MQAKLVVYKGKTKIRERLLELPAIVGRSGDVAVAIKHPVISRQHCEIVESGGLVKVRDLGSTNGTSVRGKKVAEAVLRSGDRFTIGSFTFQVEYLSLGSAMGEEDAEPAEAEEAPAPRRHTRPAKEEPPRREEAPQRDETPQPEEPPDDFAAQEEQPVSSDTGWDVASSEEEILDVASEAQPEAAAAPREKPKKRAAAPAQTSALDGDEEPDFEALLDDFFGALQGRDLEQFLKGLG